MVNAWGEEARPVVVGSSVHNQHIERHNQAVNEQVLIGFKRDRRVLSTVHIPAKNKQETDRIH